MCLGLYLLHLVPETFGTLVVTTGRLTANQIYVGLEGTAGAYQSGGEVGAVEVRWSYWGVSLKWWNAID